MQPGALQLRARTLRQIREFFQARSVLEVETPLLSAAANTDPNIDSLACETRFGRRFLRTSPEFPMKRLLAAGAGAIYELGRVFRGGERGRLHNPEFTLLEWYRPGFSMDELAEEVVALVRQLGAAEDLHLDLHRVDHADLLRQAWGIDPLEASAEELSEWAREKAGHAGPLDRSSCLDLMLALAAEREFPADRITVVRRFPAIQAALARLDPDDPRVALRFEVFVGALELANGYDELYDADALRQRFQAENERRNRRGQPAMPLDERLLAAVDSGIDPGSGVALGVDRLVMVLGRHDAIDAVIPFPEGSA